MQRGRSTPSETSTRFHRACAALAAAVLAITLASCGSMNPTAVSVRLDCLGGAVQPLLMPRPEPEAVHARGLALRIESPLLQGDPGFVDRLAAALHQVSPRHYATMQGAGDKEPQFEICITEMRFSAGLENNEAAGVICALSRSRCCRRTARDGAWSELAAAMCASEPNGPMNLGRSQCAFVYRVEFRQRTRAGTDGYISRSLAPDEDPAASAGDLDSVGLAAMRVRRALETVDYDPSNGVAKVVRHFGILVDGGLLSTEDACRGEVRRIVLERVPAWLMCGKHVSG
jgi:hypothetical protein